MIGAAIRDQHMLGRTVSIAELLSAATARYQALGGAIVVDWRSPRGGGEALIDEIRVGLSKEFRPIPAPVLARARIPAARAEQGACLTCPGRVPAAAGINS